MSIGDGDGWAGCGLRHRHWGRHGAAGLLVSAPGQHGQQSVLLVRRARWSQHGGTWAPPGGARDSHESAAQAATREASEECGPLPATLRVHGMLQDDHGGWGYQTMVAAADSPFPVYPASMETAQARWVPVAEVGSLRLHPGFAATWPILREALDPVTLIVDGANVMGSRPDGWWRDRPAAIARLHTELTPLAQAGVAELPGHATGATLDRWFPQVVLVVEGKARAAWDIPPGDGGVRVVAAPGEGDETIVEVAARVRGRAIVITADQELRRRCLAVHADVAGPRWLTGLLS